MLLIFLERTVTRLGRPMMPDRARRIARWWGSVAAVTVLGAWGWIVIGSPGPGWIPTLLSIGTCFSLARWIAWQAWRRGFIEGADVRREIERLGKDPVI